LGLPRPHCHHDRRVELQGAPLDPYSGVLWDFLDCTPLSANEKSSPAWAALLQGRLKNCREKAIDEAGRRAPKAKRRRNQGKVKAHCHLRCDHRSILRFGLLLNKGVKAKAVPYSAVRISFGLNWIELDPGGHNGSRCPKIMCFPDTKMRESEACVYAGFRGAVWEGFSDRLNGLL